MSYPPQGEMMIPALLLDDADVARWIGQQVPEIKFAVADLVPDECVTLLVGDGGSGKSILLQMAATCKAAGLPFLGRPVERDRALYITAEDTDDVVHARQQRINQALGITMQDLAGQLYIKSMVDKDFTLFANGDPMPMESQLTVSVGMYFVTFVAIDSAVLTFDDSEIDRRAVSAFLRRLNQIARAAHCAIVLIAHTSRSSDGTAARLASGSTQWVNAARAALLLKGDGNGGAELTLVKSNYSRAGQKISLHWTDDGVLVAEEQATGIVASIDQNNDDKLALAEIAAAWSDPGAVPLSRAPQMKDRYFPNFMARKHAWKPKRTEGALTRLSDAGKISSGEVRKNGKRHAGLCPISDEK